MVGALVEGEFEGEICRKYYWVLEEFGRGIVREDGDGGIGERL